MRRIQKYLLATVSSAALVGGASAADLRMPTKAPVVAPVALSWAGPYIGVNVGVLWNHWSFDDPDDLIFVTPNTPFWSGTKAAFTGGGQIGFNWQSGNFVYGLEADINWADAKSDLSIVRPATSTAVASTKLQWLSTFRARAGVTVAPPTLLYVTGGLAVARVEDAYGFPPPFTNAIITSEHTATGWTAGGGIEHMFSRNWTARIEALYVDLGDKNVNSVVFGSNYRSRFEHTATVARAALNWKW